MGPAVDPLVSDFITFLNEAWTPFHAVAEARRQLLDADFQELSEAEAFSAVVKPAGRYFFTRNGSALVAFCVGGRYEPGNGFVVVGAHTDSPCPKLKPISKIESNGYVELAVAPYGGGLWHTWFDRELSVAGRVLVRRGDGNVSAELVKVARPLMRIPTLAIHLTKGDERNSFAPNLQSNFYPVLASQVKAALLVPSASKPGEASASSAATSAPAPAPAPAPAAHHPVLLAILAEALRCEPADIADLELQLCDTQPSAVGGAANEFVFSGRLDNLCSSWQGLRALIDSCDSLAEEPSVRMLALFDHEEVGSSSAPGAAGTLLPEAFRRVAMCLASGPAGGGGGGGEAVEMALRRSVVISADMAHALHPNYADRHDPLLGPKMHGGMVIKQNANQRYATTGITGFLFREVGKEAGLPVQEFAVKNDSPCGSTIGPIVSALTGVRTVDVGCPQWSMHSCREVMGTDDVVHGYRHLKAVYEKLSAVDARLAAELTPAQAKTARGDFDA